MSQTAAPTAVSGTSLSPGGRSPGTLLRQGRERAGMSLESVADKTLIPLARLRALEADDYERMAGKAYVTGYARAYARVVGVDCGPIIESLEAALQREAFEQQVSSLVVMAPVRTSRNIQILVWVLMLVLLVAAAVGVAYAAWHGLPRLFSALTQPEAAPALLLPEGAEEAGPLPVIRNLPIPASAPEPAVEATAPEAPAAAAVQPQPSMPPQLDVRSPSDVPSVPETPVARTASAPTSATEATPAVRALESAPRTAAQPAIDRLHLRFSGDCWIQVVDATGKQIVARMAASGDNLRLFGTAPFDVVLGDARMVQMSLNGSDIAFTPPRDRLLRLRVGEPTSG